MNKKEALIASLNGEKIRQDEFYHGHYLVYVLGDFKDQDGNSVNTNKFVNEGWSIFKEPRKQVVEFFLEPDWAKNTLAYSLDMQLIGDAEWSTENDGICTQKVRITIEEIDD